MKDLDLQLEKQVKILMGTVSKSSMKTYLKTPTILKSEIKKRHEAERETAKLMNPSPHSPIQFLRKISNDIPRNIVTDLVEFQVGASPASPYSSEDKGQVKLTFLFEDPKLADDVKQILSGKISKLDATAPTEVSFGTPASKRYKVTFSGNAEENAYVR